MLKCLWFIVYGICSATGTHFDLTIPKDGGKHRSVNVALETVIEFNKKNNVEDIKFLDNVHNFIDKIKTVINRNNILRRDFNSVRLEKFTDFIQLLINVLKKFEDNDLEDLFTILSEELRKYHYKGSKFHELTDNYSLRRFIARKLDEFKSLSGAAIKKKITAISKKIAEEKYGEKEKEFIDFINSLYRKDSIDKFNEVLINLDDYRLKSRRNINLEYAVRKGVRSIFFDYYSNLNVNARAALKSKLDDFWQYIMDVNNLLLPHINEELHTRAYTTKYTDHTFYFPKINNMDEDIASKLSISKAIYPNNALRNGPQDTDANFDWEDEKNFKTTTKRKRMSFMSLYPAFIASWSTPEPAVKKQELPKKNKKHKLRKSKPTTRKASEEITLRQMYVEKNLDLKFDPYAYDHLTTAAKNTVSGKRHRTTTKHKSKPLRQQSKSKRLKVVTVRPYSRPETTQFSEFYKYQPDSDKDEKQSHENAKHLKNYEIRFKKTTSRSKKVKEHFKKSIGPLKKPKEHVGHPIGLLMNEVPTVPEKWIHLNNDAKTSTIKYPKVKRIIKVPTTTRNKHTPHSKEKSESEEQVSQETTKAKFGNDISEENSKFDDINLSGKELREGTRATIKLPKNQKHKAVLSLTKNKGTPISEEDTASVDSGISLGEKVAHTPAKAKIKPHYYQTRTAPVLPTITYEPPKDDSVIYHDNISDKELEKGSTDISNLQKIKYSRPVVIITTNKMQHNLEDKEFGGTSAANKFAEIEKLQFEGAQVLTQIPKIKSKISRSAKHRTASSRTASTKKYSIHDKEDEPMFEDSLSEGQLRVEAKPTPNSVTHNNIDKYSRSSKEEAAIFNENLSLRGLDDLGDASLNQLELLANDPSKFVDNSRKSRGIFKPRSLNKRPIKVNRRVNIRRRNNHHISDDKLILNRLQRLENELKVVKTQVKDDNYIIKDLKNMVEIKKQKSYKDIPEELRYEIEKSPAKSINGYNPTSKNKSDRKFNIEQAKNMYNLINSPSLDGIESKHKFRARESSEEYKKDHRFDPHDRNINKDLNISQKEAWTDANHSNGVTDKYNAKKYKPDYYLEHNNSYTYANALDIAQTDTENKKFRDNNFRSDEENRLDQHKYEVKFFITTQSPNDELLYLATRDLDLKRNTNIDKNYKQTTHKTDFSKEGEEKHDRDLKEDTLKSSRQINQVKIKGPDKYMEHKKFTLRNEQFGFKEHKESNYDFKKGHLVNDNSRSNQIRVEGDANKHNLNNTNENNRFTEDQELGNIHQNATKVENSKLHHSNAEISNFENIKDTIDKNTRQSVAKMFNFNPDKMDKKLKYNNVSHGVQINFSAVQDTMRTTFDNNRLDNRKRITDENKYKSKTINSINTSAFTKRNIIAKITTDNSKGKIEKYVWNSSTDWDKSYSSPLPQKIDNSDFKQRASNYGFEPEINNNKNKNSNTESNLNNKGQKVNHDFYNSKNKTNVQSVKINVTPPSNNIKQKESREKQQRSDSTNKHIQTKPSFKTTEDLTSTHNPLEKSKQIVSEWEKSFRKPTTTLMDVSKNDNSQRNITVKYLKELKKMQSKAPSKDEKEYIAFQKELQNDKMEKILLNDDWDQINPSKMFSELDLSTTPTMPLIDKILLTELPLDYKRRTYTTSTAVVNKISSTNYMNAGFTFFPEQPPNIGDLKVDESPLYLNADNVLDPANIPYLKHPSGAANNTPRKFPLVPVVGEQNMVIENPVALDKGLRERYYNEIKGYTVRDNAGAYGRDRKKTEPQELGKEAPIVPSRRNPNDNVNYQLDNLFMLDETIPLLE